MSSLIFLRVFYIIVEDRECCDYVRGSNIFKIRATKELSIFWTLKTMTYMKAQRVFNLQALFRIKSLSLQNWSFT